MFWPHVAADPAGAPSDVRMPASPGAATGSGAGVQGSLQVGTGGVFTAMASSQSIGTDGGATRSGASLLASLRTRHAVDRSMAGMRDDMRKMFGEDMDEGGEKLQVLERASVEALELRLQQKRCFVGPEHHFRQAWDLVQVHFPPIALPLLSQFSLSSLSVLSQFSLIVQVFLLLYVAITIPYREGYDQPVT